MNFASFDLSPIALACNELALGSKPSSASTASATYRSTVRLSVVDDGEMEADWPDDSPPLRSYGEGRFMDPDGTSFQRGIRMEWGLFVTPSEDDGTLHPACPSSFSSEPAIRTPALAPAPRRAKSVVVAPQSARFLTSASLRRTTGSFRGMACAPVAARLAPCARSTRTGLVSLCTPPTTH